MQTLQEKRSQVRTRNNCFGWSHTFQSFDAMVVALMRNAADCKLHRFGKLGWVCCRHHNFHVCSNPIFLFIQKNMGPVYSCCLWNMRTDRASFLHCMEANSRMGVEQIVVRLEDVSHGLECLGFRNSEGTHSNSHKSELLVRYPPGAQCVEVEW